MPVLDTITTTDSLAALGGILLFWIFSKAIDFVLEKTLHRQIFGPIYNHLKRKAKAFWSRKDRIQAKFKFNFLPENSMEIREANDLLEDVVSASEKVSEDRIEFEPIYWNEEQREGTARVKFLGGDYIFTVKFLLVPDFAAIEADLAPESEVAPIKEIHTTIEFRFAFHALADTIQNLNVFVSFLQEGFDHTLQGRFSDGLIEISPVKNELTLDEWIEEERFEVSLLLSSKDAKTEVEFYPNKAEIRPPYLQLDSEASDYLRAILLNYYL